MIDTSFISSKNSQQRSSRGRGGGGQSNKGNPKIVINRNNTDPKETDSKQHWTHHDIPTDGFAGCLLLKDDNDRLTEWLAYHWLILPLKYLVVAIDPTGTTSPEHILNVWNTSDMGMDIVLWNDHDYGHWINEELDEKHKHRARQKRFLSECERYHKKKGRTWTAIIDPDEYVTWNTENYDDPKHQSSDNIPEQFLKPEYIKEMKSIRKQLENVLQRQQTVFSFINENRDKNPWVNEQCYLMPRLFFSAVESSDNIISKAGVAQNDINLLQFSTLRYFHHAQRGEFEFNHYGKVIVDLQRIKWNEISSDMYSVHRPNHKSCFPPTKPYFDGLLRVHHYLGSWEQYSSRSDVRRSRGRFDKFAYVDKGTDYQLQKWLQHFIDKVGIEKARKLLENAGKIDMGSSRIMDKQEFMNVEIDFEDLPGNVEVFHYIYDEDGSVIDVQNSRGKSVPSKLKKIHPDVLSM